MFASSVGYAGSGDVVGKVNVVLVDGKNFGGCMAQISQDISDKLPACKADWVTFDCLGVFPETTKSIAQNQLSTAQLAFVTRKNVYIKATDSRRVNGYCLVERIDLIN